MENHNLHERLQHASQMIKEARNATWQEQKADSPQLQQAWEQLQQAESELEQARRQAGTDASENSQYQQAAEELHNLREKIQEIKLR